MSWIVLVDGYNVLQSWPQFSQQLDHQFDLARGRLIRMIANFAEYQGHRVIAVFDAPQRNLTKAMRKKQEGIEVVYTKQNQTADDYIVEWIKRYKGNEHILGKTNGNRSQAAKILEIQRTYLSRLIKELDIQA